jgi:DNA-binding NarL/FixJ family response regulator
MIVDDHAAVHFRLSELLSSEPDMAIVGEAADGARGSAPTAPEPMPARGAREPAVPPAAP